MTTFVMAPYKPSEWQSNISISDLRIDPAIYMEQLLKKWPNAQLLHTSANFPLQWILYTESGAHSLDSRGVGSLHSNLQVVYLDTPYEEFFLWHRSVIPARYRLFLFNVSSLDSLEITSNMTMEDLRKFLGGKLS